MFPNTFWVTKTYIVLYFPKPWTCNHHKIEIQHYRDPILKQHSKINSQPVFFGYCFQTHSRSRKHILFYIFPSLGLATTTTLKSSITETLHKKLHFAKIVSPFFLRLFPNTFWVTKTYIGSYFPGFRNFMFGFQLPCFLLPPWHIKSQLYFITCPLLPP